MATKAPGIKITKVPLREIPEDVEDRRIERLTGDDEAIKKAIRRGERVGGERLA